MLSAQELFDQVLITIDLLEEVADQEEYIELNKLSHGLSGNIDDDALRQILSRLQNEEQILVICDERENLAHSEKYIDFLIKVTDRKYIKGWIQDIRDRQRSSKDLVQKFDDSLIDPGYEQALEIFEDNDQIFITGSLLHGYSFNIFPTTRTKRIKRILLSLLRASQTFNKTKRNTYAKDQIKLEYKSYENKYFQDDMLKSDLLRKDINQETTLLFQLIAKYLIDVNGTNYSFCPALGRAQFNQLDDQEKFEVIKQTNKYLWSKNQ